MSRTVHLHVGIAKTGTTYLQRTLYANRELLRRSGVLYPGPDAAAHFLGSLDLRGATFKGHTYERAAGAWDRLVEQANAYRGNTLISHETLAHASPEHIERAVRGFTTDDVRVVITARDLARQIPAAWQEQLKNRGQVSYDAYLTRVLDGWRPAPAGEGRFWGAQDVRGVVSRWGDAVGRDRVTVVTVPPSGADRSLLWQRFAQATDLPAVDYEFAERDNSSLGVAEAELLRRMNPKFPETLEWPRYDGLVKKRFAEGVLASLQTRGRLRLPEQWQPRVREISAAMVEWLASSGVRVVGDLGDLAVPPDSTSAPGMLVDQPFIGPDHLSDAELLDTALEALAALAVRPPAGAGQVVVPPGPLRSRLWNTARAVRDALPAPVRERLRRR